MDPNKISVQTFNDLASRYAEKYMDVELYNDTYDGFMELLQPKTTVLELGCGPGNISKYIIAKRPDLEILATDAAPDMLKIAKALHPNIQTQLMDCRELHRHKLRYGGVAAGFCLPYLSPEECTKLFTDVQNCLLPDGVFYLSVIDREHGESGLQTSASTGLSVYQYFYQEQDLEKMWRGKFFPVKKYTKNMALSDQSQEHQLILILRRV